MKLKNLYALALLGAGLIISNITNAQWTRTGSKTYLTNVGDSLGIGTINPACKVDIQSTGIATMSLKSTTSNVNILFDRKTAANNATLTYRTNGVNNWQTGTLGNNNYILKNNSLNSIALFSEYTTNNIGIGTTTPGAKLEVAGQVKITGGAPGAGKVLTSDANGLASWTVPATGGFANGTAAGNTPFWNGTTWVTNSSNIFNNGGNVGIGTTTPTVKLDVSGGEVFCRNAGYGFTHTDGNIILETYLDGTSAWIGTETNHNLNFYTNNSVVPQLTLATSGNFGIGTATPSNKLTVAGNADFTGNVGIGNTAPSNKLSVTGNANFTGNVGIGTATPTTAKLVISGTVGTQGIDLSTSDQYANMRVLQNTNSSIDKDMYIGFQSGATSSLHLYSNNSETVTLKGAKVGINQADPHAQLHLGNLAANRRIVLWEGVNNDHQFAGFGMNATILRYQVESTSSNHIFYAAASATTSNELMRIQGDGRVSIGSSTAATGYKLTVGGKIICTELKVQVQPFPDYVFADTYNLKSIDEVEQHIKTYNRLPGMPSACEVEENGMNVGDMQTRVVEKVEENTLYIIQLKKEIDALKAQLDALKK